jgi:hypothetical protein
MRTTLALDDDLLAEAEALIGVKEKTALVREALKALIEHRKLSGWDIGNVDAGLLASWLLTPGATLWTRDARLAGLAKDWGLAANPTPP